MSGTPSDPVQAPEAEEAPRVGRWPVDAETSARANRTWWDADAADYRIEHGDFLGAADFVWGPERLREEEARLLGDVRGKRVLEVGCGGAQCARWLGAQGAAVVGTDISAGMLREARALDAATGSRTALVQCDARRLPFADASVDVVCSAYGALPFVADVGEVLAEIARVLVPAGLLAFSVAHPLRWALPDDPGEHGLVVRHSYFDRTPYVETEEDGSVRYVEHHRTMSDWVRALVAAGFVLQDLVEPQWSAGEAVWGGWSRLRGELVPGTAVFVARSAG
ncbi:methyltransferase family protein [Kineococcus xinjiangensis]|uniref:Methyltransferase family protein n=1 Tax=Kineococcus xinjiangensis TaxID=512762 RepID=A0A2S6IPI5_9ACTN|nr:class I SAM-dependent methyltransferase [Kineococcus xinjiangensis]PPK96085.1 methyltransferase family protein [Kineococcus xinjiangensis]